MRARSGEIDIEDVVKSIVEDHVNERNTIVEGRVTLLILTILVLMLRCLWTLRSFKAKRIAERGKISFEEALAHIDESDEEGK